MKNLISLCGLLVAIVSTGFAGAQSAPNGAALKELAPTGTLRVAVFTGNPVIGTTKDGVPVGTTVTLGRTLAERVGVPVQLIEYTAVAKLVEDAKNGAWDIAVVAFDPGRKDVIEFAPPHLVVDLTYLLAPDSTIQSAAAVDAPGVKVAAARGAATTLILERTLKQATVVIAETEPGAFAMLRDGRAQAYAQNRYMLLALAERLPGTRVAPDRFAAAEMCIVLPKGHTAALAYVGEFVGHAKRDGTVQRAIDAAGLRGVTVAPAQK
jgi:polar amino acid transport system substrate-binding protein